MSQSWNELLRHWRSGYYYSYYCRQSRRINSVVVCIYLFVCPFVHRITKKFVDRLQWNFHIKFKEFQLCATAPSTFVGIVPLKGEIFQLMIRPRVTLQHTENIVCAGNLTTSSLGLEQSCLVCAPDEQWNCTQRMSWQTATVSLLKSLFSWWTDVDHCTDGQGPHSSNQIFHTWYTYNPTIWWSSTIFTKLIDNYWASLLIPSYDAYVHVVY